MKKHMAYFAALMTAIVGNADPQILLYEPFVYPAGDLINANLGIWSPPGEYWRRAEGTIIDSGHFAGISQGRTLSLNNGYIERDYNIHGIQNGDTVWIALTHWRRNSNYWGGVAGFTMGNFEIQMDPGNADREKSRVLWGGVWSGITAYYRGDGDQNPYLYVVKITNINAGSPQNPSVATLYVLTPQNLGDIENAGGPFTENALLANHLTSTAATNENATAFGDGTATLWAFGDVTYAFDELRVSDDLDALLGWIDLPVISLPDDVENVAVSETHAGKLLVEWDAAADADNYVVERKFGVESAWATVATVSVPEYLDTDVVPDACYQYRVAAQNQNGFSTAAYSPWISTSGTPAPSGVFWLAEDFRVSGVTNNAPVNLLCKGYGWKAEPWDTAVPASFLKNSLAFSDRQTNGGSITLRGGGAATREIRRAPEIGATVWAGALLRIDGADYGRCARLSFTGPGGDKFTMNVGVWDWPDDGLVWVNVAGGPPAGGRVNAQGRLGGRPLMLVAKFTNHGAGSPQDPQRATMWLLDENHYDAIKTGGILESELDINCAARATSSHTAPVALAKGDVFRVHSNDQWLFVQFDEFRMASTLTSVVSGPPPDSDINPPSMLILR